MLMSDRVKREAYVKLRQEATTANLNSMPELHTYLDTQPTVTEDPLAAIRVRFVDQQGKEIAAEIWSQMEPQQKVQFASFEAFFQSGIWKQILQQLQQDQSGIRSQAPEMSMSENVNMAEQMPGGGIADVDVREKVAMAANGGLMGLYNRGM